MKKQNKTEDRGEKGCSVGDIRTKQRLKERQKIRRAVAGRKRAIKPRGWKNGMEERHGRTNDRGRNPGLC